MSSDLGIEEGEDLGDFEAFPLALGLGSNMATSSVSDSSELHQTKGANMVQLQGTGDNDYFHLPTPVARPCIVTGQ